MFAVLAPDGSAIEEGIRGSKPARTAAKQHSKVDEVRLCRHRRIEDGDSFAELTTWLDGKITHYKGQPKAEYIAAMNAAREASRHAAKLAAEKEASR